LSYTAFQYGTPAAAVSSTGEAKISVEVTNTGAMAGDEVVQLYVTHPGVPGAPLRALKGFQRIHLDPKQKQSVSFTLGSRDLSIVDESGKRRIVAGTVQFWVGGGQPTTRPGLPKTNGASAHFTITQAMTLPD